MGRWGETGNREMGRWGDREIGTNLISMGSDHHNQIPYKVKLQFLVSVWNGHLARFSVEWASCPFHLPKSSNL
ncbi:hypothetical protein [Moorena sp. SIO3H5]|uniref:hypothetical protein n=1 Tax=Moorena sp. SIO3H5 TaxID=2607834 RepID=UPI0013B91912|nr:hypothetical protein [Moorena sp. SIO3H5]NEO73579.1 hypothetical protein [Moorena sp. SIO3H5]